MRQNKSCYAILMTALLAAAGPASAEPGYHGRTKFKPFLTQDRTSVTLSTGLRMNEFDYNIASDIAGTQTPNILSELTWSDIAVYEIKGQVRHIEPASIAFLRGSLLFDAEITGGLTIDGENQDSDYLGDNRTLEFSRSNNNSDSGYAIGGALSVGYRFNVAQKVRPHSRTFFTLAPLAGYGWDRQEYTLTDGFQTIPATGAFAGLDSTYTTNWYGPFVGIEAELERNRHLFTLRGEYHSLEYQGEGVWNLRADFQQDPSFEHEADGDGIRIIGSYAFAMDSRYAFTLDAAHTQRTAEDGIATTYFSNGNVGSIRFNEANDTSSAFRAGLRYAW